MAKDADLGDFRKLLGSERRIGNLHRAFAEAHGTAEDVDVLRAFHDMAAFHGRLPDCHA